MRSEEERMQFNEDTDLKRHIRWRTDKPAGRRKTSPLEAATLKHHPVPSVTLTAAYTCCGQKIHRVLPLRFTYPTFEFRRHISLVNDLGKCSHFGLPSKGVNCSHKGNSAF